MPTTPHRPILTTLAYGLGSVVLYILLYLYADQMVDWAQRTRHGEKIFFIVPILVAFAVSYFHGAFTGHFWESLGLRAAKSHVVTKKSS